MIMEEIPRRVHFVGIGGVGMSGLAQHLHNLGYTVTGSDRQSNDRTVALQQLGIKIHIGHNANNVGNAQMVVHTSAVHNDNVEVAKALVSNIPVVLREQLLGAIFNSFSTRIAVCGTHGKTTVTAMIHQVLTSAGVSHTAFIGGVYDGNNYFYGKDVVVAEACEFNRSFYNLNPTICVCLNAEFDHPDSYRDQDDVHSAFKRFMLNTDASGTVVLPKSLLHLCTERQTVAFDSRYDVSNLVLNNGKPMFDVTLPDSNKHTLVLNVAGKHNVNNALATLAVAELLNLPFDCVKQALTLFSGVDRRWTEKQIEGIGKVVCDYAHHPTELTCSVATAQSMAEGKVLCVFQPHTYSRTKAMFKQFATCFTQADKVAYLPIYSAREIPIDEVNSPRLTQIAQDLGIDACFLPDFTAAKQWILDNASPRDIVLLLGAGDVCQIADML